MFNLCQMWEGNNVCGTEHTFKQQLCMSHGSRAFCLCGQQAVRPCWLTDNKYVCVKQEADVSAVAASVSRLQDSLRQCQGNVTALMGQAAATAQQQVRRCQQCVPDAWSSLSRMQLPHT